MGTTLTDSFTVIPTLLTAMADRDDDTGNRTEKTENTYSDRKDKSEVNMLCFQKTTLNYYY